MNVIINVDHFFNYSDFCLFSSNISFIYYVKDYIVNSTMCIPNVYVAVYTTSIVEKYYGLINDALNITTSFNIIIVLVLIFKKYM